MKQHDDPEVLAWLEKARRDLAMAERAISEAEDEHFFDQACFHSQQAAEKALKALLVHAELPVPHTHDLVVLVHSVAVKNKSLHEHLEAAAELSKFSVAPRYPMLFQEETEKDARSALKHARMFLALANDR